MSKFNERTADPINPEFDSERNYVILRNQKLYNGNLKNKIGYCDGTYNIVTGCTKYSDGCLNCYSYAQTKRCQKWHPVKYRNGFTVTTHPHMLQKPFTKGYRKYYFVCSMSDLFHSNVPDSFIHDTFDFFHKNMQHTFIILTKRAERLAAIAPHLKWSDNIWCGVTVESDQYLNRIDLLRTVPAKVKLISAEPLLSSIKDADLTGIDLVVTQGESGKTPRPINPDWVREIRDKCAESEICFFFKGWGGTSKKKSGDLLDGVRYKQLPIPLEEIKNRKRNNRNKNNKNNKNKNNKTKMSKLNATVVPAVADGTTPNNNVTINPTVNDTPLIKPQVNDLNDDPNKNFDFGLISAKTANNWILSAQTRPIPRMLLDEMWYENELCVLFSDTNAGKSILSVQAANSLTNGIPIQPFITDAAHQRIFYLDMELSEVQFWKRYSNQYSNRYNFSNDFVRSVTLCCPKLPKEFSTYEEYFYYCLEASIFGPSANVLIIDNLTNLSNRIKNTLNILNFLNQLKKKYKLSILVIAHTPKRNLRNPISINDLRGSRIIMDEADSSFAIGKSCVDPDLRYVKQIKQRDDRQKFGEDNVCVFKINKPDNFLQFDFVGYSTEAEHLLNAPARSREEMIASVIEQHLQGRSLREISEDLNVSHMTVKRIIDKVNNR